MDVPEDPALNSGPADDGLKMTTAFTQWSEMAKLQASLSNRIEEVIQAVESETGERASADRYPCLLRIGANWGEYPFSWEPFRDLAGPIHWPDEAPPIILISSKETMSAVEVLTVSAPHEHTRLTVAPSLPLALIVDAWISQLIITIPRLEKSSSWFLKNLQMEPDQASPTVLEFLGIETKPKAKAMDLSGTIKSVSDEIGDAEITAFAITELIKKRHPEYASNQLGQATFAEPQDARSHKWEVWRDSVGRFYDSSLLKTSHHQVIDGTLFLAGLGLLEPQLREALEKADIWAPLLLQIDEAAVSPSGPLREALNAIQLAHGYENDQQVGEDRLGIQGEVKALCEVIMDPDVSPPLAVGLFGRWGSGKSFFMEKMMDQVHALSCKSSKKLTGKVVQIRFNAWHYVDTSLWASLAVEIFERLADPEPIGQGQEARQNWLKAHGDPRKQEREALLSQLETYRQAKVAIDEELEVLERERNRLIESRDNAEAARRNAYATFSLTSVAEELGKDADVQAGLNEIGKSLGMTPALQQLSTLANELQTSSGYLLATAREVGGKGLTFSLLFVALALLIVVGGGLGGTGVWERLGPLAVSLGAAVMAFTNQILPAARKVNQALTSIHSTIQTTHTVRQRLMAKKSREEQELSLEIDHQNQRISEASQTIASLGTKIASLEAQSASLSVGRRLYDFLAERAAGYQKHQGVIGMLHRDFRLLDAQLRAQPGISEQENKERIARVILYIDDLDRCSPEKVLEVLEAVHLLLALELFIVVVGVDPRWLDRSLRHQYRQLSLAGEPGLDPYLRRMPIEYLEKIFQIPLTLPAMEAKAYGDLVSSLAPRTTLPTLLSVSSTPSPASGPAGIATPPAVTGGSRTPTRALLEVQKGSAAAAEGAGGAGGTSIDLTSNEVMFAQHLSGLMDTPRATKRLMNTYRLIRATQHVGSRSRFLGADGKPGESYAVLTLLALAAGFPMLADHVLLAIEENTALTNITTWPQFVDALEPPDGSLVPAEISHPAGQDQVSQSDAVEWERMVNGLKSSLGSNKLLELNPYRRWGPIVARFSFRI